MIYWHTDLEFLAGALFLLIGAFFFWRFMKRRSRRNEALDGSYVAPLPPKPSRGARILAKIPIVRDRFGSQSWVGITETSFFDEKRHQPSPTPGFDLLGYMPDQPAPAVLMPRGQAPLPSALDKDQFFGLMGVQSASSQGRLPSYYEVAPVQQQNISPLSSDRLPRDSAYQPSETGTSLSSAFGTGTHIPPTPMQALHPPPPMRHGDFNAPEPQGLNTRRDTTYTQSSIASSVPRFRTIHSWVRQQTSRSPLQRPESQEGGRTGVESGQL